MKRLFFWLSGASTEGLEQCPTWEQRKYVAFGATVLVPAAFAFIACAYALSTISADMRIIIPVALVWSLIILTIDRALLATYRSFQPFHRKIGQFLLRFVVAMLMGLTISHPLTLLLFKDTIASVIEGEREAEIEEVRAVAITNKKNVEDKIVTLQEEVTKQRDAWDETYKASFLVETDTTAPKDPTAELDAAQKAALQQTLDSATAPHRTRIEAIEAEIATMKPEYEKLQGELNHWQTEFEREVNGQRSGIVGLGPRAKSIHEDQLTWRRAETKRLSDSLETMSTERNQLRTVVADTEKEVTAGFLVEQADKTERENVERARIAGIQHKMQEEQAAGFVVQQDAIRASINDQVETRLTELKRLQAELASVATDERGRIDAITAEPRRDLLTQTLALHKLFRAGDEGGTFALVAYGVLALLFMLIDTIPLVVKFFSKAGPYDTLVDCEEVRFDKDRKAFLKNYDKYMDNLSDGRLLSVTKNQPLERALVEGVDRSRVAKEFMESLIELERAFEERMELERARLAERTQSGLVAAGSNHGVMLEEMAQAFYADMRARMEAFFRPDSRHQQSQYHV
jgi:uncharacterized membrane protein